MDIGRLKNVWRRGWGWRRGWVGVRNNIFSIYESKKCVMFGAANILFIWQFYNWPNVANIGGYNTFFKFKNVKWDNSRIFSEETTYARLWIGLPGSLNLVLNQYSKLGISCSFNWFSSHNIFCKLGLGSGHSTHSNILETFTTSCTIQEGPHPVQYS